MLLTGTSRPSRVPCPQCTNVVEVDWKVGVLETHTIRKAILDKTRCPGSRTVRVTFKSSTPAKKAASKKAELKKAELKRAAPKRAAPKKAAAKDQAPTKPQRAVQRTWMGEPTNSFNAIPIGLPGLGKRR